MPEPLGAHHVDSLLYVVALREGLRIRRHDVAHGQADVAPGRHDALDEIALGKNSDKFSARIFEKAAAVALLGHLADDLLNARFGTGGAGAAEFEPAYGVGTE